MAVRILLTEIPAAMLAFATLTCIEYFYHRHVGHCFDKTFHPAHHRGQVDKSRYPAWAGICASVPLTALTSPGIVQGILIGLLLEVCLFITIHALYHSQLTVPSKRYARLKREHHAHHKDPRINFGVTTRLWDRLFKTMKEVEP